MNWYSIKALSDDEYEVAIYDEIGFWGITAKQFLDEFKKIPAKARVFLRINSPGGDVFDGMAIYNIIERHEGEVIATIDGLAASMASVIALAANRVEMPDNAYMMIHNPWGVTFGDADDMRDQADLLDKIKSTIVNVYAAKSGKSAKEIARFMDDETWLTGAEAREFGLVDEVTESVKLAASFNRLQKFTHVPECFQKPPVYGTQRVHGQVIAYDVPKDNQQNMLFSISGPVPLASTSREPAAPAPTAASAPAAPPFPPAAPRIQIVDNEDDRHEAALAQTKKEWADVAALCQDGDEKSLVGDLFLAGKSLDAIRARLTEAREIHSACLAARLPGGKDSANERAAGYIKAGLTVDEARAALDDIRVRLDAVDIDNKFTPNSVATHASAVVIDTMAIYAARKKQTVTFTR